MTTLEWAVLRTLVYSDIFGYPLKGWEIHKWLISQSATLDQVEKVLVKLIKNGRILEKSGYFSLKNSRLVKERLKREQCSRKLLKKAWVISWFLKLIPWIRLIGVSGSLALNNAKLSDDIDLVIITSKNRIWSSRLLVLTLLSLMGVRRKRSDKLGQVAGKVCVNILLEEDRLALERIDLYIAHELLQMRVLHQKSGMYSRFLMSNEWVEKYLPNWVTGQKFDSLKKSEKLSTRNNRLFDRLEILLERLQLKIMDEPKGMEKIDRGVLFFHPVDYGSMVMDKYKLGCKAIV